MKKTHRRLNKKGIALIIIILIVILSVFLKIFSNNLLDSVKKHYNKEVLVKKNSLIYEKKDNDYVKVGTVEKDTNIKLEKNSKDTEYFQILNTNYYLFYKDCSLKLKNRNNDKLPNYYVAYNKNVTTEKNTILYLKDKKIFKLETDISLPLIYSDSNYYYVEFANEIYGIKKDNSKLIDSKNTEESVSDFISVIHYKNIASECNTDDCIAVSDIESNLKKFKDNNYYSIDEDDYIKWNNGNVNLKKQAILIIVDDDKLVKKMFNKYNYSYIKESDLNRIKLVDNNKTTNIGETLDNLGSYLINNSNNEDIFNYIMNGTDYITITDPAEAIAVLNYHFFYDKSRNQTCEESICLEASIFEEQLKYLKDNGYKTLTIDEFKKWMYGEIELPKKSVLLTIDDGAKGTGTNNGNVLIPLLEKYQSHATLFLISGWWSPDNYRSKYLDIQSHTSDMHRENYCTGEMRGSQLLCSTYEEILDDLTNSLNDVDSDTAFCFPYYAYNDKALKAVKEKGFKIAFVGGEKKATRNSNKYLIPRYVVYDGMPLSEFAKDIG